MRFAVNPDLLAKARRMDAHVFDDYPGRCAPRGHLPASDGGELGR
jgi:hypothetical protein